MSQDRSKFPPDECRKFEDLLGRFRWPFTSFDDHVLVVEIVSKCGLCSSDVFADFLELVKQSGLSPEGISYLHVVAELGRSAVHGPESLHRQSVEWLSKLAPNDELLTYSICELDPKNDTNSDNDRPPER
jgi:hypothetical protein